jgi:hypothetical protein
MASTSRLWSFVDSASEAVTDAILYNASVLD